MSSAAVYELNKLYHESVNFGGQHHEIQKEETFLP